MENLINLSRGDQFHVDTTIRLIYCTATSIRPSSATRIFATKISYSATRVSETVDYKPQTQQ